jgi:uroporphyrinogen III methyltransferase / synthase
VTTGPDAPLGGDPGPEASLLGRRVLVPRAAGQAAALSERIRARGGEPVEAPVLTIEPGDREMLHAAVRDLAAGGFALVCLTSPNGVDAVAEALAAAGFDARAFAGTGRVACVGRGTAARLWARCRIRPDLVPPRATTRALGEAVPPGGGRALLPRADLASPILPELLAAKGYEPVEVVAYRTGRPEALPADVLAGLRDGSIDLLAVASPSTARNLVALAGPAGWAGRLVSIGPVTTAACEELGVRVAAEADRHDLDGLVAALVRAAAVPPPGGPSGGQ